MKGLFQGKPMQPEGDLWDHTMLVLSLLPPDPSFTLAFAALLHDVGKPATRSFQHGRYTFHNHEQVGAAIAERLCRAAQALQRRARADHLAGRLSPVPGRGQAAPRVEAQADPGRARDRGAAGPAPRRRAGLDGDTEHVDYCRDYLEHQPTGPINPPPLVTGHDLVRHGLKPGPRFAVLLERVREAQLEGQIHSKREALEWVDRQLRRPRECRPVTDASRPSAASGGCRSDGPGLE